MSRDSVDYFVDAMSLVRQKRLSCWGWEGKGCQADGRCNFKKKTLTLNGRRATPKLSSGVNCPQSFTRPFPPRAVRITYQSQDNVN